MSKIITLDEHRQAEPQYSFTVYRKSNGEIVPLLDWADTKWIETNGDSVAERFEIIANDMPEVGAAFRQQGIEFADEEE